MRYNAIRFCIGYAAHAKTLPKACSALSLEAHDDKYRGASLAHNSQTRTQSVDFVRTDDGANTSSFKLFVFPDCLRIEVGSPSAERFATNLDPEANSDSPIPATKLWTRRANSWGTRKVLPRCRRRPILLSSTHSGSHRITTSAWHRKALFPWRQTSWALSVQYVGACNWFLKSGGIIEQRVRKAFHQQ